MKVRGRGREGGGGINRQGTAIKEGGQSINISRFTRSDPEL